MAEKHFFPMGVGLFFLNWAPEMLWMRFYSLKSYLPFCFISSGPERKPGTTLRTRNQDNDKPSPVLSFVVAWALSKRNISQQGFPSQALAVAIRVWCEPGPLRDFPRWQGFCQAQSLWKGTLPNSKSFGLFPQGFILLLGKNSNICGQQADCLEINK